MPPDQPTPCNTAPAYLRRRFELASIVVPIGGRDYELFRPRNVDDLISEEDFAIDERIPYWADCWPSARVLAGRLAGLAGQGLRLLELGCGIGLVSTVAADRGFDVLATDYYADALEFTAANADANAVRSVETRLVDWRQLPEDLGTFDRVVAADVLYEQPQAALIANAMLHALAPGGLGLVTDPGSAHGRGLPGRLRRDWARSQLRRPHTDIGRRDPADRVRL